MYPSRLISRLILKLQKQEQRYQHNGRNFISKMFHPHGIKAVPASKTENLCPSQKALIYRDYIYHSHAGGYCLLPLGQRVFDKLIKVIEQELSTINAQKISMVTLHKKSLWKKSGRWDAVGPELFKMKDRHGVEYCLGPTHEEIITQMFGPESSLVSYKQLPIKLYQITRKFRDERSPKYALLRGREFEMKDLYTFDATVDEAIETYESVCEVYCKILERLQLSYRKAEAATGKIGGTKSHEFHLEADIGEDKVMVCDKCGYCANVELPGASDRKSVCTETECQVKEINCIEVGHSFLLGTKYSEVFKAQYGDKDGEKRLMEMGCYGLGVSRLLQACIEVSLSATENKFLDMRWPKIIAPYQICIIPDKQYPKALDMAVSLSDQFNALPNLRGEVVIDDVASHVGSAIKQKRCLGYPYIIPVKEKAFQDPASFEVIDVYNKKSEFLSLEQLLDLAKTLQTV